MDVCVSVRLSIGKRMLCAHLHTGSEHLVALQQVVEREVRRLVLGFLPEPDAVALDDQCHGNQFL